MSSAKKCTWLDKFFDKEKKKLIPQTLCITIPAAQTQQTQEKSALTPLLSDLNIRAPSLLSPKRAHDETEVHPAAVRLSPAKRMKPVDIQSQESICEEAARRVEARISSHKERSELERLILYSGDMKKNERETYLSVVTQINRYAPELLKVMMDRRGKPAFLIADDFDNSPIECHLASNDHAIYCLVIKLTIELFMYLRSKVPASELLGTAFRHQNGNVYLKGKIGETTSWSGPHGPIKRYFSQTNKGRLGEILYAIKEKFKGKGSAAQEIAFWNCIRVIPIVSHQDINNKDLTIKIEQTLAMLVGPEGNFSTYVGRFSDASSAQKSAWSVAFATEVIVLDDGTVTTRAKQIGAKSAATRAKPIRLDDGSVTTRAKQIGAKTSTTLAKPIQLDDGSVTTRAKQIGSKTAATMAKPIQLDDGSVTTTRKQTASRIAATLAQPIQLDDGSVTTRAKQIGAKTSATLTKPIQLDDGSVTTLAKQICSKAAATMAKPIQLDDGSVTTTRKQTVAKRYTSTDESDKIKLDAYAAKYNLPRAQNVTLTSSAVQYGWPATCPKCGFVYCTHKLFCHNGMYYLSKPACSNKSHGSYRLKSDDHRVDQLTKEKR